MQRRILAVATLALSACASGVAKSDNPVETVVFTATSTGLTASNGTSAGYTTLTFTNQTDSLMAHELVRLRDDVSADSGLRAIRVFHGIETGDRMAAVSAVDRFMGGAVFVAPHTSKSVSAVLPSGRYVSYADVVAHGAPRVHDGFVVGVEVGVGVGRDSLPKADYTVRMTDNAFDSPSEVTAGRARWRVENAGAATHLAFIFRVLPGHTADEAVRAIMSPEGAPPVEDDSKTLGVHALSPGAFNDVELNLEAGEYVIACFIGGHHMAGMVRPLTVRQ